MRLDHHLQEMLVAHLTVDIRFFRDSDFEESDHPRSETGQFATKYALAHHNAHKAGYGSQHSEMIKTAGEHLQKLVDAHPATAKEFEKAMQSSDNPSEQLKAVNRTKKRLMDEPYTSPHKPGPIDMFAKTLREHIKASGGGNLSNSTNAERIDRYLSQRFIGPIRRK